MAVTKTLVVLANSYKHGGRCLAGVELVDWKPKEWVRPVSSRSGHELNQQERQFADRTEPAPLDVVEVRLSAPAPTGFQNENWLVEPQTRPAKLESMSYGAAHKLVSTPQALWVTGYSTVLGINDKVPASEFPNVGVSITLVKVTDLKIEVAVNRHSQSRERQVRALFNYRGKRYKLLLTDPMYKDSYLQRKDETYPIGEALLTVSLGEPISFPNTEKASYKLVAAVIEP